jgi:ribosomal protein S19
MSRQSSEPPAQVTPAGIDPRPRTTGHNVVDLIIAGSAILISCVSLFIATQQSRTMERTLAASIWPLLQFASGNTNDSGQRSIEMAIENQGIGPAIVRKIRTVYAGKEYDNLYVLMRDCCGYVVTDVDPTKMDAGAALTQPVEGKVIRAGDKITFFKMDLTSENAESWRKLDAARFKMAFDTCYCSVLGDCWQSDLRSLDQAKVDKCPIEAKETKKT